MEVLWRDLERSARGLSSQFRLAAAVVAAQTGRLRRIAVIADEKR